MSPSIFEKQPPRGPRRETVLGFYLLARDDR